jgi:hypothetical protein
MFMALGLREVHYKPDSERSHGMSEIDLIMDDALAELIIIEAGQLPFVLSRWLLRGCSLHDLERRIAESAELMNIAERARLRITTDDERHEYAREWEKEHAILDPDYVAQRAEAHKIRVAMVGHPELEALYKRDAGRCSVSSTAASEDRIAEELYLAKTRRELIARHKAEDILAHGIEHLAKAPWRADHRYGEGAIYLLVRADRSDVTLECLIHRFCNQGWEWIVREGWRRIVDGYTQDVEEAKAALIEELGVVLVSRDIEGGGYDDGPVEPVEPTPDPALLVD